MSKERDSDEAPQITRLAIEAAHQAGRSLRKRFLSRSFTAELKDGRREWVSEADREAEALIRDLIGAERPDDQIEGEELGVSGESNGHRWIIDPLDGTTNFVAGIPVWSVSIACEQRDGEGLAAVVLAPMLNEEFVWSPLLGSTRDGSVLEALDLSCEKSMSESSAKLELGTDRSEGGRGQIGRASAELLPSLRHSRNWGTLALELCWLASGGIDLIFDAYGAKEHDWAAGRRLVEAQGLEFRAEDGVVIAGRPELVSQMHRIWNS